MRIYLDVCCLNRPFDDQTQERVRLESEAVLTILNLCRAGEWQLIGSEAIDFEVLRIPDDDQRNRVAIMASVARLKVIVDTKVEKKATELAVSGFKPFDALHIACAEKSNADILLTTDDRLLRRALQSFNIIEVRVENPVRWLMEVINSESSSDEPQPN